MTSGTDPLDRLAPALDWVGDWDDVLRRASESDHAGRLVSRRPARRTLVLAFAVLVVVLVPIVALASANDWWFLRSGGAPTPVHAPGVVKEGTWSGHPWQLIAYASSTDGLCFVVTPATSQLEGRGAAMACAPFSGIPRTQATKPAHDMTITYLSGSASALLPAYIAGPVIEDAEDVEIHFSNGDVLRAPTFPAPESVGPVRFYATPLPAADTPESPGRNAVHPIELAGLDESGNVVACLVPRTAVNGISPLSDCR
jgi:hypothetical protein